MWFPSTHLVDRLLATETIPGIRFRALHSHSDVWRAHRRRRTPPEQPRTPAYRGDRPTRPKGAPERPGWILPPRETRMGHRRVGTAPGTPQWWRDHPEWSREPGGPGTSGVSVASPTARFDVPAGDGPDRRDPNAMLRAIMKERVAAQRVGSLASSLVTPHHLRGPSGAKELFPIPRIAALQNREEIEEEKTRVILSRMASSTQRTYTNQIKWWEIFCHRRGEDPIRVVGAHNRSAEESLFMDFIVHCATNVPRSEATIKTRLAAIRALHVNLGLDDPMADMKRIDLLLQGYSRLRGAPLRRHPVTPRMLRWVRTGIRPQRSLDDAVLWAALLLGFFFLLRVSEYLAPEHADGGKKGLRGIDLTPRRDGVPVTTFREADEVVLRIRGSKTDQLNEGHVKNHFRSGNDLCVVEALDFLQTLAPRRWREEKDAYLLISANGQPLRRAEVHACLTRAATALGGDPSRMGTHSLRFGGASALWAAYRDSSVVKRWGRWASEAFQGYLWEARSNAEGVAAAMAKADLTEV